MPLWRGLLKGTALVVLFGCSIIGLWYGAVYLLLGKPWMRLVGLVLVVGCFRGFILGFDLMWGRPAVWSKDATVRARARQRDTHQGM